LHRFQKQHGYDIFLLDMHIDQRFLDAKGIDAYSQYRPVALPEWLEEMFAIRLMRHIYHYRADMSPTDWVDAVKADSVNPEKKFIPNQYVLTKEALLENAFEHPYARSHPSQWARENQPTTIIDRWFGKP
jgi:hypothetical protein